MNKAMLLGRLGADPELKFTQGGQAILKLRMATAERYKDNSGEWKERTEWHSVVVWGGRGESLVKLLSKGSLVFVEGRISTRSWEGKDGKRAFKTEVVAEQITLCGDRRGAPERSEAQNPDPHSDAGTDGNIDDIGEPIPF